MSAVRDIDTVSPVPTAPPVEPVSVADGVLELQVRTLLERVRDGAARARWDAESDAQQQVDAILTGARREARLRLRAAAREKRERVAERCRKAVAAAETRDRASAFTLERELARRALLALPAELARRWNDPEQRRAWCEAAIRLAARRLVARDWRVEAAASATPTDRRAMEALARTSEARIEWAADVTAPPEVGLRIVAGGVVVDATVDGLLADRAAVEASVLAALHAQEAR